MSRYRFWEPREVEWVEEAVPQLPRRAALAFSARCARRASVLFRTFNPWAPYYYDERIWSAVELVEWIGAGRELDFPELLVEQLGEMIDATRHAFDGDDDRSRGTNMSLQVLKSINCALRATREERPDGVSDLVLEALNNAFWALWRKNDDAPDESLLRDLRELLSRSQSQGWTDETPVAPGEFGPLPGG